MSLISLYLPKDVVRPEEKRSRNYIGKFGDAYFRIAALAGKSFGKQRKIEQNPYGRLYDGGFTWEFGDKVQLASEPGKKSVYSNHGYGLLWKIFLELKAEKSLTKPWSGK